MSCRIKFGKTETRDEIDYVVSKVYDGNIAQVFLFESYSFAVS